LKFLVLIYILILTALVAQAQSINNYRNKTLYVTQDTLVLDSLSIVPFSVIISDEEGRLISANQYKISRAKNPYLTFSSKVSPMKLVA